jgi:hypothetical protein
MLPVKGTTMNMTINSMQSPGRRGGLKALLSLPAMALVAASASLRRARGAVGGESAPALDVIRQSELLSIFDDLDAVQDRMLGYRRRILAGASVEPGPRAVVFPVEGLKTEAEDHIEWDNFYGAGLTICETEWAVIYGAEKPFPETDQSE